eukprot:119945-Amphidinium_carterae.1
MLSSWCSSSGGAAATPTYAAGRSREPSIAQRGPWGATPAHSSVASTDKNKAPPNIDEWSVKFESFVVRVHGEHMKAALLWASE